MHVDQKHKSRAMRGFLVWWAHTDLNRGPKDYELLTNIARFAKLNAIHERLQYYKYI